MRLGILTSHPIQYQAPWFRALARVCEVKVFFAHNQSATEQGKTGFGQAFEWDVDLLSGYEHQFLKNISATPGVNHFHGCDTPEIAEIIRGTKDYETIDDRLKTSDDAGKSHGLMVNSPMVSPFDAFIVNGWYLKSYRQASAACRAAGVPVLVRGDSQLRTPRPWFKRLAMEFTQRRLLRQFDGFLTVGQRNREYLEHFGAPPERIFFTPHFVDNEWFAQRAKKTMDDRPKTMGQKPESMVYGLESKVLRQQWGADDSTFVALFVGKFQPEKRPGDLLHALFQLKTQNSKPQTFLAVFVGSGELEAELRAAAARLGVKAYFAGFKNQSELPACYAAADALVLPSESETWGLVVNEAMACGCPAVVSDACGCAPDLIEDGQTGFVFPSGKVDGLAEKLAALAKLKLAGHDFAPALAAKLKTYSIESAVTGTLEAVQRLMPPSTAAPPHRLDGVRVLVLFAGAELFGAERANLEVFRSLRELGLQARFLTHKQFGGAQLEPELKRQGFEFVPARFGYYWGKYLFSREFYLWFVNLFGLLAVNWRVWREAKKFRATHLYATSVTHYSYAMLAFAWLGLPVIYRSGDEPPSHTGLHRWLVKKLFCRTDAMVCISQHIFKKCAAAGMAPEKMRVIYNSPPQRATLAKLELPSVPSGAMVIVFVGQVTEQKGIFVLLDAVEQMLRAGANVVLWVVGSTGWDETGFFDGLKTRVTKAGVGERIVFLGYVTDVGAVLARADVHVCPSIYEEPLSNVVGEAKLAGKPSVVFPSGGLPELIEQGVDGFVCRERSVAALVEGLEFFTNHPARCTTAGAAARRSLEEKFSREKFVGAWAEVFLATRR